MVTVADERKKYFESWKSSLKEENSRYQKELDDLDFKRNELRAKSDVLTRLVFKHGQSNSLEKFKDFTNYEDIKTNLEQADKEYFDLKEDRETKIMWNNLVIDEINLLLQ